jgi:hypothetical protein
MSRATRRLATATATLLVAGLAVAGSPGAATASQDNPCPGMSAPRNTRVANQAPVLANDTARVVAGSVVSIKVLSNDSDPDGDKLYVTSTTNPGRGETCISSTGVIEYLAGMSATDYTQNITYGVTDGDLYRTARITVSVEGIKPLQVQLKHKLVIKQHKVKHRARVAFTNPNRRSVLLVAGDPNKKSFPSIQRFIGAGQTIYVKTKIRRLVYVVGMRGSDGDFMLVSVGLINTRTGRQRLESIDDSSRTAPSMQALAQRAIH